MLDGVYGYFEFEIFEGIVCFYGLKGGLNVVGSGVGREGLDHAAWTGLLEIVAYAIEDFLAAREEGDGEVAMFGVGEDSGNTGSLETMLVGEGLWLESMLLMLNGEHLVQKSIDCHCDGAE